ncbi:phosphoribosylanthranilate isomerase [Sulfitobacter sp. M57]|uniref:phosphoribosylanthranilate isomerase n=1 Tax=unclassified Sulfitobacter TaxID=196795 RepID=UPI0023E32DB9|nr:MULTISPECIES: phosphoribosylanthranilate isomerase [unclassified Sulfitobacter]MDF3415745.1 phosphoribosylanthranilate isomerase [Sulfitobacter sp. KE5]MDF3423225.1 phosphoribosylanthranilate isomerase [Sulfitobacter sp. KE43]MDF3434291.1 phosphoribosylanthranilate isomerase [Sulfitobacter sp. KE42]MDF3459676.1 phosphoribosylanthranilate isomerase [Sulfitobacter sp. S74]MDF3463829.1 phosphoribosylanthranilate isomerase [Sulfitobacter sp. Ks18]
MPSHINVKICGVTRAQDIEASVKAGARYIGLNFFPKSPRFVSLEQARELALGTAEGVCKVGLVVNPTEAALDALVAAVPVDMIQLHGGETPARVVEIKQRYGLPVMKAVGVADADDLLVLDRYAQVADQLLVDTKPPKNADLPGGNGLAFDWTLIAGRRWTVPWMLAGGLNAGTVAEAIRVTGAGQVDLSSAVESAPGVKDAGLIQAFCDAALAD